LLLGSDPETLARVRRISAETHEIPGQKVAAELARFLSSHGFWVRRRPNPVHDHLGFLYAEQAQLPGRTSLAAH
jgi:hypothetical protein